MFGASPDIGIPSHAKTVLTPCKHIAAVSARLLAPRRKPAMVDGTSALDWQKSLPE